MCNSLILLYTVERPHSRAQVASCHTWNAAQAREVTRCMASSSSPPTSSGRCPSTKLHSLSNSFTSPLRTRHDSSNLGVKGKLSAY